MKYSLRHITALPLTALLLLCGCAGESYPGLTYDRTMSPDIINDESGKTGDRGIEIELYIAPDSFALGSPTRGTGPFVVPDTTRRDSNHYENSFFHVFAFRASPDDQGPLTYMPDYRRRSNDPTDQKANCLIDNNNDFNIGLPAQLDDNRSGRLRFRCFDTRSNLWNDTLLHYNINTSNIGYNFYAYYIDDFKPSDANTSRTGEGVCYNIDLDGTRDLMYGVAPRLTPAVLDYLTEKDNLMIGEESRTRIINNSYYTGYAAYYGVRPYVQLHHALTRLRFQAFPADATCDSVTIESIEVQCRNKAHLWIVRPNNGDLGITFEPEYNYVTLMDPYPSQAPDSIGKYPYVPLDTETNTVTWKPEYEGTDWKENPPTTIGGDMLVSTDSVYRMKLTYRQTLRNKNPLTGKNIVNRMTSTYDLYAPETDLSYDANAGRHMYLPGHTYNINIGIYGLRAIVVNTGMEGWQQGEDIPPNDEDDFDRSQ